MGKMVLKKTGNKWTKMPCPTIVESVKSLDLLPSRCYSEVRTLFLARHHLVTLPKKMWKLTQLQKLSLIGNEITQLPKEIGKLVQLQELDLMHNYIDALPKEIKKLVHLEKLFVNNNALVTLPPEIGYLPRLEFISLFDNPISKLQNALCAKLKYRQVRTNIDFEKFCQEH